MKNDKKEKLKHNLVGWIATFAIAGGIAFATIGVNHVQKAIAEEEIPQLTQPLKASYDDNSYTITLSADELNDYTYHNLANCLNDGENDLSFTNSKIIYQSNEYLLSS